MNIFILIISIIAGIILLAILCSAFFKRSLKNAISNSDFTKFDKLINSAFAKIFLKNLTRLDLKASAAMQQKDDDKVYEILEIICSSPLLISQKERYYMRGFDYFVKVENKKYSKIFMDAINTLHNQNIKKEAKRIYNIFILKNDKELKSLLKEVKITKESKKAELEYYISLCYKNKKDTENAKKYEKMYKEHLNENSKKAQLKSTM